MDSRARASHSERDGEIWADQRAVSTGGFSCVDAGGENIVQIVKRLEGERPVKAERFECAQLGWAGR